MTAVAVVVVKKSSVLFGIAVADSGLLAHNKIKDKPRTRKKFAEQSWQVKTPSVLWERASGGV